MGIEMLWKKANEKFDGLKRIEVSGYIFLVSFFAIVISMCILGEPYSAWIVNTGTHLYLPFIAGVYSYVIYH